MSAQSRTIWLADVDLVNVSGMALRKTESSSGLGVGGRVLGVGKDQEK
ncbi:hypothetical protein ACWATR_32915 [Nostoc sp. UIC 10890]